MPAEAQTFFIRTFNTAAANASVLTLKPVYTLLHGSANHLLGILSSEAMLQLEDNIFSILRNIKGDTSSLSLYCLAILHIMMAASEDEFKFSVSSYDTQELLASVSLTSSRWTPDAVRQFFHGEKAQRTTQLVVLRAMWACTSSTGEQLDERIESLRLANEIVGAIPVDSRATWRKGNALLVRKLEDKVSAPELEPLLRHQGLCFLLQLTRGGFVSALVMERLREIVSKPNNLMATVPGGDVMDIALMAECGIFDQSTTTATIQNLVDFLATARFDSLMHQTSSFPQLLTQLSSVMQHDERVVEGVMLAIDVLSCGDKLQQLQSLTNNDSIRHLIVGSDDVCQSAIQSAFNDVIHDLSKLLLVAAHCSRQSSYSLSQETHASLVDILASSARLPPPCQHARKNYTDYQQRSSVIQVRTTQTADQADWRSALELHLISKGRSDTTMMSCILHYAVAELEDRCHNVEQPLREEQQRRQAVEMKYDELSKAYSTLEQDEMDRDIALRAADAETQQYLSELHDSSTEVEKLVGKVNEVEMELKEAIKKAESERKEMEDAREMEDMKRSAICARQEEDIEMVREQLTARDTEVERVREEMIGLQEELDRAKQANRDTTDESQRLRLVVSGMEAVTTSLQAELETLTRSRDEIAAQAADSSRDLATAVEFHRAEMSNSEQRYRMEKDDLIEQHSREIAEMNTEVRTIRERLSEVGVELSNAAHLNEQQHARLKKRERKTTDLQQDVERWRHKCSQRDRQIEEANAMRANLMAAMGLEGLQQQPLPESSLPFRPSRPLVARETDASQGIQDDPSPPTPFSGYDGMGVDADSQMTTAQASFASNGSSTESKKGPTPKRARPRRSVKALTPAKTTRVSAVSRRSTRSEFSEQTAAKRQPLSSMAVNEGVRKSEKTPSKGVVVHGMDDETTFDGSEIFGGTQG